MLGCHAGPGLGVRRSFLHCRRRVRVVGSDAGCSRLLEAAGHLEPRLKLEMPSIITSLISGQVHRERGISDTCLSANNWIPTAFAQHLPRTLLYSWGGGLCALLLRSCVTESSSAFSAGNNSSEVVLSHAARGLGLTSRGCVAPWKKRSQLRIGNRSSG